MTPDEMNQVMEKNPFAKYLDMKLTMVGEGQAVGTIPMKEEYSNIYGGNCSRKLWPYGDDVEHRFSLSGSDSGYGRSDLRGESAPPWGQDHGDGSESVQ